MKEWTKWIAAIGMADTVMKALDLPLASGTIASFEYMRTLSRERVRELLLNAQLAGLTDVVMSGIDRLSGQAAASGAALNDKFQATGKFEMRHGKIDVFFGGLEQLLGPPRMMRDPEKDGTPTIRMSMQVRALGVVTGTGARTHARAVRIRVRAARACACVCVCVLRTRASWPIGTARAVSDAPHWRVPLQEEHCAANDSKREFTSSNQSTTTSATEWEFAYCPVVGKSYPERKGIRSEWCREPRSLDELSESCELHANRLLREHSHPLVILEELLATRLYVITPYQRTRWHSPWHNNAVPFSHSPPEHRARKRKRPRREPSSDDAARVCMHFTCMLHTPRSMSAPPDRWRSKPSLAHTAPLASHTPP